MRARLWWAVAVLSGCGQLLGIDDNVLVEDPGEGDPCEAWHSQYFDACAIATPLGPVDLTDKAVYVLDTTSSTLKRTDPAHTIALASTVVEQADGTKALVVSVDRLRIAEPATLRVIGSLPLIVAAASTIEIDGRLDAGSHAGEPGPGAQPIGCTASAGWFGTNGLQFAAGGGGGAFGGDGGDGGDADQSTINGGNGGRATSAPVAVVRGGCRGGDGGYISQVNASARGIGGDGGGAVQLAAAERITISSTGRLAASGAGGRASASSSGSGGGGGGSGGMVGLEAATVVIRGGNVVANGGGGGNGSSFLDGLGSNAQLDGEDGRDDGSAARGATPHNCGGGGGDGSWMAARHGLSVTSLSVCAGGGGGGGAGVIRIAAGTSEISDTAVFSPPPVITAH